MSVTSVQFRNAASVVQAYTSRNVPSWSIWQGKQFMFKHEADGIDDGKDTLLKHLDALKNSAAIYTLKVYEDLPEGGKIRSNTPDDGSFNFRFMEYAENGGGSQMNEVLTELRTLKLQVEQMQEEPEEEEPNKLGMIGEILELPGVGQAVANAIPGLLARILGTPVPAAHALAGVPADADGFSNAVAYLTDQEPNFPVYVMQLAKLAHENPSKFQSIIGTLKMFL